MQILSRNLQQIEPLVRHGVQELQAGAPIEHVLREIALMGSLVGSGVNVSQAIRSVEQIEPQLLSFGGWERTEAMHTGAFAMPQQVGLSKQQVAGLGKQQPAGFSKQQLASMGKQQVAGYGVPYGYGTSQFGVPMGNVGYGQQIPMTYAPTGKGWMGK